VKINLGCGKRKLPGYINVDNRKEVEPDILCDVSKGLPWDANSVDEIVAIDLIEHLTGLDVINLMNEIHRVLKPGGLFYHRTPSTDGRGAFQDPTHKSFWNINTWRLYFSDPAYRELYGTNANFKIKQLFDTVTDPENKIIHTQCLYEAIK